jgi:hemoglobin/transferrin/lactoferrin receptor protein
VSSHFSSRRASALTLVGAAMALWLAPASAQDLPGQDDVPEPPPEVDPIEPAAAQDARPPARPPLIGETLVVGNPLGQEPFLRPYSFARIDQNRVLERADRTLPQSLRDIPSVMVQETSNGQGSPFIRGFTAFRNVLLIDGVRLNNSVFREGPNQYWATVDPYGLDAIEVQKGPSSVLYGSDAIGGAVQALTKSPRVFGNDAPESDITLRGSTAERSIIARFDQHLGLDENTGLRFGGTVKDFGELQGGRDIGQMENTDYNEWNIDGKLQRFLEHGEVLTVGAQSMRQHNVPRTHSTIFGISFEGSSIGSDLRRDLDQERELVYVQLEGEDGGLIDSGGLFDRYHASISWQRQAEAQDRIRSSGNRTINGLDVNTLGTFWQFEKDLDGWKLAYGFDYYHDNVDSFSTNNPIQGSVGDESSYDLLGIYAEGEIPVDEKLTLFAGARFSYAAAEADSVEDPVTGDVISVDEDWSAVVGNLRASYLLAEDEDHRTLLFGGASQGFRAPNLSDLTSFEAFGGFVGSAPVDAVEVPTPNLDPEYYTTFEIGIREENETWAGEASVYYTDIRDGIQRFPNDDPLTPDFEVAKDNLGDGYVAGVELGAAYNIDDSWSLFGNATWQDGKQDTVDPDAADQIVEDNLSRLMPLTGQLGVRYEPAGSDWWIEGVLMGADKADELSIRDAGDTQRIPPGGTPGYVVAHLRGGWQVAENGNVGFALENLTDEDYRIHGSGSNMPGLNLILTTSWTFK